MKKTKSQQELEKVVYKSDASQIQGEVAEVIFPKTAEEIIEIVKTKQNIVPRGGGTGLAGGCVPLNSAILDMSKMDKILSVDKENKVAEVEAGVILENLNLALKPLGLEFPVNPSSYKSCTIGGMIACNAVGTRAAKYGRTSDWIKEIEMVNGKGEILKMGKIDFSDVAGLEGLTGIIVKAKLGLAEIKNRTAGLIKINDIEKIPEIVRRLKLNSEVCGIEILDKLTSKILGLEETNHVLIEYESDAGNFKGKDYQKIIDLRNDAYPKLASEGFTRIEDPKSQVFKLPQLIRYLEENKIPFFGHVAEGILHPCFKPNQEKEIESMLNFVKKLHGSVSGEHGIGLSKKKFLESGDKRIIQNIKKRHDPENKLNPNKVIDLAEKNS
jgi:glycolate oxidase/D-lactate dehydrogenase